ncbi:radical SAM/SPASM domain-containing protein [Thomasclavelia spiroformis]|uniref:radical SAM/SPASM domain-containing protein n=1 Tax=Thomasclavelia spiroformis TaxID=29348 RepID=UPI000B39EE3A|nr:radical SAM protein [Thomasclavelia spiroformis]OUO70402.1 radical SAM protein [Thomasclavelia spiroformis]
MNNKLTNNSILNGVDIHDEIEVSKKLKKEYFFSKNHSFPIASLQFELTSHCNAKCKHCYNNSGLNEKTDAMTVEKWISFSKYLVEHGGVFECILSGGEPLLLGNGLFKIMDVLNENGTIFFLITNGYLLNEPIVEKLKKYRYHKIQISIDGICAEYHDSFRQKKGNWEKAVYAAKLISKNNIPLKIAHCVTPYNISDIDKMCDLAYSLGAQSIMIGELSYSGRAIVNSNLLLSTEQRNLLYIKVKENSIKYKDKMKVKCSHSVKEGLEKHLKFPKSGAIIRPNGDIRLDGMAPFVIGNILKDDFANIWENKLVKSWENTKVIKFINDFNDDDRNYSYLNYIKEDTYL